jgi:hypothetical protein
MLGNMERAAQNNQQDLCVASITVPYRVNQLGDLLCEQAKAAYSTDMMIDLIGRGFAPVAAVLSFIADNGATEVDPGFGTSGVFGALAVSS